MPQLQFDEVRLDPSLARTTDITHVELISNALARQFNTDANPCTVQIAGRANLVPLLIHELQPSKLLGQILVFDEEYYYAAVNIPRQSTFIQIATVSIPPCAVEVPPNQRFIAHSSLVLCTLAPLLEKQRLKRTRNLGTYTVLERPGVKEQTVGM